MNLKRIFLIIVLVAFLSISVVGATEINDSNPDDILTGDSVAVRDFENHDVFSDNLSERDSIRQVDLTKRNSFYEIQFNDSNDGPVIIVQSNSISASSSDLQQQINNAPEGAVLKLTQDYSITEAITISKSLTIDGQGHALDGGETHNIILVRGGTITFKDLVFKNGYADSEIGGSINIVGDSYVTVTGCTFTNSKSYRGGAIFNYGAYLVVTDSTFTDNKARLDYGGAILSTSNLIVTNCFFKNNVAKTCGGAIFNSGNPHGVANIRGSTFIQNSATDEDGGAIYNAGELIIGGCTFEENTAVDGFGGAINSDNSLSFSFEKTTFTKNHATNGGAIAAILLDSPAVNLVFDSNYAYAGGAVDLCLAVNAEYALTAYFKDCEFKNNYVKKHLLHDNNGGAIRFYSKTTATIHSSLTIDGCTFTSNKAHEDGGVIYVKNENNDLIFKGSPSYLEYNYAGEEGGAIYCEGCLDLQTEVTFNSNTAETHGGAIYVYYLMDTHFSNGIFIKNTAHDRGGAIYFNKGGIYNIESCIFQENSCQDKGGAIYFDSIYATVSLNYNVFDKNEGGKQSKTGNDVYNSGEFNSMSYNWWGQYRYDFKESIVEWEGVNPDMYHYDRNPLRNTLKVSTTNTGVNTQVLVEFSLVPMYGGDVNGKILGLDKIVFGHDNLGDFSNLTVKDNSVSVYYTPKEVGKHTIYYRLSYLTSVFGELSINVDDSSRSDNKTQLAFDDCYCLSDLQEIIDKAPENSIITLQHDYAYFHRDYSLNDGKGIKINKNIEIRGNGHTITGSFKSRALYSEKGTITLKDLTFADCKSNGDGGVIYITSDAKYIIENCDFHDNLANEDGGAIFNDGGELKITKSSFIYNTGSGASSINDCDGGAIHSKALLTVEDCIFTENFAADSGGAIYATSGLKLSGTCIFAYNTASKAKGGAIRTSKFESDVSHAVFINNRAGDEAAVSDDGGAIYINNENRVTFSQCVFVDNHCTDEGGAIYVDSVSSHISLINNIFSGNGADDEGQVVFNKGYYDSINNNFWSGQNPSSNNDELIEWKSVKSNVHHVDKDPLTMGLNLAKNSGLMNEEIKVTQCFYTSSGGLSIGEMHTADVSFSSNSYALFKNRKNGGYYVSADVTCEIPGTYTITADLYGYRISQSLNIRNFRIIAPEITTDYDVSKSFEIYLSGDKDLIVNKNIQVTLDSVVYNVKTDEIGYARLNFDNYAIALGKHPISIYVNNVHADSAINIKSGIFIDVPNVITAVYDVPRLLKIHLYGHKDLISNKTMNILFDNKYYEAITDNEGYANLTVNNYAIDLGKHPIKISAYDVSKVSLINVMDLDDIELFVDDLTMYYGGDEECLAGAFDKNGLNVPNLEFSVQCGELKLSLETDNGGTARFTTKLGVGYHNVAAILLTKVATGKIKVLSTIYANNVVKIYKNETQFEATFRDSKGNFLAKDTEVQFDINGVTYIRKIIDDQGKAILNINLEPGVHYIVSTNMITQESFTNTILILSKIADNKDLVKYYRNGTQFSVKTIGKDGNIKTGEVVKFTVNGVTYNRISDENGVATLNINLNPGKYDILTEYGGNYAVNDIIVKSIFEPQLTNFENGAYSIKLLDGQGNPYANQIVKFNINGVFYQATTDDTGLAKLKLNLMKGTYIITAMYNGLAVGETLTI